MMRWFGRRRGYLMDKPLAEDDLPVVPGKGAHVIDTPGLPDGYVPPSASLAPPARPGQETVVSAVIPPRPDSPPEPPPVSSGRMFTLDEAKGVCVHAEYLTSIPEEWVTAAKDVHVKLARDRRADLGHLATHRFERRTIVSTSANPEV